MDDIKCFMNFPQGNEIVYLEIERFKKSAQNNETVYFEVKGDCMEGRDISDGDIIAASLIHMPEPRKSIDYQEDICIMSHKGRLCVKEYVGVWGSMHMCGTKYKEKSDDVKKLNAAIMADEIFGIVFAAYTKDRGLKWSVDVSKKPSKLSSKPTIIGGNIQPIHQN